MTATSITSDRRTERHSKVCFWNAVSTGQHLGKPTTLHHESTTYKLLYFTVPN